MKIRLGRKGILRTYPRNVYPTHQAELEFVCSGPAATADGDFERAKIADLGCVVLDDKKASNKYYHAAVVRQIVPKASPAALEIEAQAAQAAQVAQPAETPLAGKTAKTKKKLTQAPDETTPPSETRNSSTETTNQQATDAKYSPPERLPTGEYVRHFVYTEWGRTRVQDNSISFMWYECDSEANAQALFVNCLMEKNVKRGIWVDDPALGRVLQPKPDQDLYLVRPQAVRSTGLASAKLIGLQPHPPRVAKDKTPHNNNAPLDTSTASAPVASDGLFSVDPIDDDNLEAILREMDEQERAPSGVQTLLNGETQTLHPVSAQLVSDLLVETRGYIQTTLVSDALPTVSAIVEAQKVVKQAFERVQLMETGATEPSASTSAKATKTAAVEQPRQEESSPSKAKASADDSKKAKPKRVTPTVSHAWDLYANDPELKKLSRMLLSRIPRHLPRTRSSTHMGVLSPENLQQWHEDLDLIKTQLQMQVKRARVTRMAAAAAVAAACGSPSQDSNAAQLPSNLELERAASLFGLRLELIGSRQLSSTGSLESLHPKNAAELDWLQKWIPATTDTPPVPGAHAHHHRGKAAIASPTDKALSIDLVNVWDVSPIDPSVETKFLARQVEIAAQCAGVRSLLNDPQGLLPPHKLDPTITAGRLHDAGISVSPGPIVPRGADFSMVASQPSIARPDLLRRFGDEQLAWRASAMAHSRTACLFHGTRSRNVLNILRNNFVMPKWLVGVVISGALLGPGMYFADDWRKSAQFTVSPHAEGSKFAAALTQRAALRPGASATSAPFAIPPSDAAGSKLKHDRGGFLFLSDVILGKPREAPRPKPFLKAPHGHHSVLARAGSSPLIVQDEWVVYDPSQQIPRYLVEFVLRDA
ncbi:hypothetical protein CAOG_07931 [Capsaspora owczarzaki ATCC 30864]|uniref:Poly [ADP-ribose] polymerase n=1 Tax=Capsaspora owczarzaki (strain ATCC 30864) TaxID=595528 RepID=A0A0D2X5I1_CAPO3|nr:hypothetical protein CAOG_07931 [Capsaspora owczarzaki ATCC 30864]KJE97849.1 hypothetical protein CAOG_007931 [Capsaspora owczarzaki ATCC 30864]|eukprot:XP_004343016.1 hypothetical protein CAOG_07931 [Capsaspora owczarzaki ATCC 30864]